MLDASRVPVWLALALGVREATRVALQRTLDAAPRRVAVACLTALCTSLLGCASTTRGESCYPNSTFSDPAVNAATDLEALASQARPANVSCTFTSSGFQDLDQVLYISRPTQSPASAALQVWTSNREPVTYEAPIGADLGGMLEEICGELVRRRASCTHRGRDGVWYLLQAPGGAAVAWSPRPGTMENSVIDTFTALRADVTAPDPLRWPAYQTLRRELYDMYAVLGLFDDVVDEPSGVEPPPRR